MRVTIRVRGSAILYLVDNLWNVAFITDECHQANLRDSACGNVYVRLGHPDFTRRVTFTSGDQARPVSPKEAVVDRFLNMASPLMHEKRNVRQCNLDVYEHPKEGRKNVHMTIPYGALSVTDDSDYFCYTRKVRTPFPLPKGPIAREFEIVFDTTWPLTMTIDPAGGVANPVRVYNPETVQSVELDFDNYCGEHKDYNDFIHIYDWVKDIKSTAEKPIEYVAGRLSSVIPAIPLPGVHLHPLAYTLGPDGDCDPVIIEPPPGP